MEDKAEIKKKERKKALYFLRHDRPKNILRNRFFAVITDFFVVAFLCFLLFFLFGFPDWAKYMQMQDIVKDLPANDPLVIERMRAYQFSFIQTLAIGAIYEALMLILFGGTVGKLLFRFRVIRAKETKSIFLTKLMLLVRALIKALSIYLFAAIPFLFLSLTVIGNPESRSGFDFFAGTKVIYIEKKRKKKNKRQEDST